MSLCLHPSFVVVSFISLILLLCIGGLLWPALVPLGAVTMAMSIIISTSLLYRVLVPCLHTYLNLSQA